MLGMSESKCEILETLKIDLIAAVQHQESLVGMVTEVGERRQIASTRDVATRS